MRPALSFQATRLRRLAGGLLLAGLAAAPACGHSPAGTGADGNTLRRAADGIGAAAIRAHVSYLAGDALRGRLTPGPGLSLAAAYVEQTLRGAGLAPAGDDGGFRQPYPCAGVPEPDWPTNVVALLRGSDPARAGEWVVVSAHYDHVGIGAPNAQGDSIYNGADDNASGTAALLEVARALASLPRAPARSVAFLAVSGEELGLVGSRWYVQHPPTGTGKLVADINLDMVGRNAPDLLYLVGDSYSTLGAATHQLAQEHPELQLLPRSNDTAVYRQSDQLSFALAGTPALFFFTGDHADLHRPSDELDRLDTDKASRIARLAFYLTYAVASAPESPAWTPAGDAARRTLKPYTASCAAGA